MTGDYSKIKPAAVLAWLDMPTGKLVPEHSPKPANDVVEFFPPGKVVNTSIDVQWAVTADCVVITPFGGSGEVAITFSPGKVAAKFGNNVEDYSTGDIVPGVEFDYEVLYSVLDGVPSIPPIPVSFPLVKAVHAATAKMMKASPKPTHHRMPATRDWILKVGTGIDCAPAEVNPGGP